MTRRAASRAGFGLIELLVAISIMLALGALAFMMYPGVRDQDQVRNTVTDVAATCKLAQGMAARDKRPRGVRFLYGLDSTNPKKTDPLWVTELQYIELPPPLIPNRNPLTPGPTGTISLDNEPRVKFAYNPTGAITNRQCLIQNLTFDQASLVQTGCTIVMPVFGTWHRITSVPPTLTPNPPPPTGNGLYNVAVGLEVYPDAVMGAGTDAVVYHFAIYPLATPLVGEPTVLLPRNVCVDLNTPSGAIKVGSLGPSASPPGDFDVIFAPDGKLVGASSGQLFLHVRDYTKGANLRVAEGPALADAFRRSGEQYYLTIRSSGALGHAPVTWPDASGFYPAGPPQQSPFTLARQSLE